MEPYWSSVGFFGSQLGGSLGADFFYGQDVTSPGLLMANAAGALAGTLVTNQILNSGSELLFFMARDAKANKGVPAHLTKDLYEGIALSVVGGTVANVLVRHLFFQVPLTPALIAGAASAALTWGLWVQPRLPAVNAGTGQ